MKCDMCGQPQAWLFELLQDVRGVGPSKKHVCFICIGRLGEQLVGDEMRKRQKEAEAAGPETKG